MHNTTTLVLIYHSVGLEDHVICAGLVFYMAQIYFHVVAAVHVEDLHGFKFLFRGHKSIQPLVVDDYDHVSDDAVRDRYGVDCKILRLGNHKRKLLGDMAKYWSNDVPPVSYAEAFYADAGLPFDTRWTHFYAARDFELEAASKRKANIEVPFAFVIDDPSSSILIDESEIPAGMGVFNPRIHRPFPGSTVFDLGGILESATVIHAYDGLFTHWAEHLNISAERKVIHRYANRHRDSAANIVRLEGDYRAEWEIMELPVGTLHVGLRIVDPADDQFFDLEDTSGIDVVFSVSPTAIVPRAGELFGTLDGSAEHSFGEVSYFEQPDRRCEFALNGLSAVERNGHCELPLGLSFTDFWVDFPRNRQAYRGRHVLQLRMYGLYRHGRYGNATIRFRLDTARDADGTAPPINWFLETAPEIDDTVASSDLTQLAINFASQTRMYEHDPVFSRMPLKPKKVDPEYVTEFTGLKVPRWYDCGNLDPGGGKLANYDYFSAVPSRWFPCLQLQSFISSGQKIFLPSYPIVDDEYPEAVTVYEAAMAAKGPRFAFAEFGARWGTWGFRSAAAVRAYNPAVEVVDLLFVEPNASACGAIRHMARVNGFELPRFNVTVQCHLAQAEAFRAWAASRAVIDVLDLDIQGAEYELMPDLMDVLTRKVRRIIIGTHAEDDSPEHVKLKALFAGWRKLRDVPFRGAPHITGFGCIDRLRSGGADRWQDQSFLQRPECGAVTTPSAYGPLFPWDGEMVLENPYLEGC